MKVQLLGVFLCGLALTACANFNTAYRDFSVDDGSGAMVDIKQRAIIASRVTVPGADGYTIVCAEPSPDAISAYAAELAAEGSSGGAGAAMAAAVREQAAFVGLRTQSIQLLRDAFYRACEGYMGNALTQAQFDILSRRYQRYMVALLGIEQLTGIVRAPSVTLTNASQAEAAQSLVSLQAQQKANTQELEKKREALEALDDGDADARATLQEDIAALEETQTLLNAGIENAKGLTAGGSGQVLVSTAGLPSKTSDATLTAISGVIENIVEKVLETDDLNASCLVQLTNTDPVVDSDVNETQFAVYSRDKIIQLCDKNINAIIDNKTAITRERSLLVNTLTQQVERGNIDVDELIRLIDAFSKLYGDQADANPIADIPPS